jgi:hypothetical protein
MRTGIGKALGAGVLAALLATAAIAPAAAQVRLNFSFGGGGVGVPTGQGRAGISVQLAQSGQCLTNREIRQAVVQGRILPLASVLAAAGIGTAAQVLNASVCETPQGPVYYVSLLGPAGQARNIALNAVNGSPYIGP